jgi:hypothetical protein
MTTLFAGTSTSVGPLDGFVLSLYLSILAMPTDKEGDVHELRAKHLLRSFFSNQQLLDFFKGLLAIKNTARVMISVHNFLYNNFKTIATVLSIASVLDGIFKTIRRLKQR